MKKELFMIDGMTCASCQSHITHAVEKLDGVKNVNVNLLTKKMVVEYDEEIMNDKMIILAVGKVGYKAYQNIQINKRNNSLINLIVSGIVLIILMYFSMGHMFNFYMPNFLEEKILLLAIVQLILALIIVGIYRKYFIVGFKKLFRLSPNMDSLIAIGAFASLIYGIISIFMIANNDGVAHKYYENLYFESVGMILVLVSLGKYFEDMSKKKTTSAITKLVNLAPKTATILENGEEVKITIEEVRKDDILIVKNGEMIPVDGIIESGDASLDQSSLTGESMPVIKEKGDMVYSSSIVTSGYIKMKAIKIGEDSSLSVIIKLVEEASNSKAPISRLVDKVSFVFVPIIILISIISFIVNIIISKNFELSFNFAISVLVIACPCALGLATPVSIMVGTGKGAENGLLIKNAEILEKSHNIKKIVLDKTGTITEGKPKVVDFITFADEIIDIVYSLEKKSEHPLANAIVNYAKEKKANEITINQYESISGRGIKGMVNSNCYYIGNTHLLKELNIKDNEIESKINEYSLEGKTSMVVVKDTEIVGIINVKDNIKKTSVDAIKELMDLGIEIIMLTGDNKKTAETIAKEVGIERVIAEVLPEDKQKVINSLKNSKDLVAMVGDGVNDALALTSADIGIVIGAGSDVAIDSADIILIRDDLLDVKNIIQLSKRTLNTIKINLFWALFYNCIGVVLATGLFYYNLGIKLNPMISALAMSFSSVFVVLTSLSINLFKVKKEKLKEEEKMQTIIINVEGMMCKNCKRHVEEACMKVNGVKEVEASIENKNVTINACEEVSVEKLIEKINEAGYLASEKSL